MKLLTFGLFCIFLLTTKVCLASGSTVYGKIDELYVNGNWTMVKVPAMQQNPDGCESSSYYALNPSDKNYSTLHSTIMAAQVAKKSVKFWVSGCGGQNNGFPHIVSVWVKS